MPLGDASSPSFYRRWFNRLKLLVETASAHAKNNVTNSCPTSSLCCPPCQVLPGFASCIYSEAWLSSLLQSLLNGDPLRCSLSCCCSGCFCDDSVPRVKGGVQVSVSFQLYESSPQDCPVKSSISVFIHCLVSLSCYVDAVVATSHSSRPDKASSDKVSTVSEPLKVWKGNGIARSSSLLNLVLCVCVCVSLSLSLAILSSNCEFFNFKKNNSLVL